MTNIEPYRDVSERQAVVLPMESGGAKADNIDIAGLTAAFMRRRGLFFSILGITFLLTIVFLLVTPPQYTATARVTVLDRSVSATPDTEKPVVSQLPSQSSNVDTETQVIQSRRVVKRVVDALHLDKDPEFSGLGPKKFSIGTVIGAINHFFAPLKAMSPGDDVINNVLGNLLPARYSTTNAIDINFKDRNPRKAQRIANAFARAYLDDQVEAKLDQSRAATAGLYAQIEGLREQADDDSAQVQAYKIAHNLMSVGSETLTEQEISSYNQGIAAAKAEAAGDVANLQTARDQLAHGSNGDDVGEALISPVIGALRSQRAEISGKVADLEGHYGPKYPDLAQYQDQLADLDGEIKAEIQRTISNLAAKAAVSQKRLAAMESTLAATKGTLADNNAAEAGLDNLMRAANVSQSVYEAYLARSKESIAQASSLTPDAEIVSNAALPEAPSFPVPLPFLALGLVAGLLFGLVGVIVAEMTESRLMTSEDIEHRLGSFSLGAIPLLAARTKLRGIPFLAAGTSSAVSAIDAVVQEPSSAYSEGFRALRAAIGFSMYGDPLRVVLISSAFPGEGKTTVSAGLARTSALLGVSSIVVDCDFRRRGLTRAFKIDGSGPGLIEVLRGEATLAEALVADPASATMILPMRAVEQSVDELFGGDAMKRLLDDLKAQFQLIVLDAAPALPVAATRILAAKADTVVLVTQWRKTSEAAVRSTLRLLQQDKARIAGVVLSRVDLRQMIRYGRTDAGRFFKKFKNYYA